MIDTSLLALPAMTLNHLNLAVDDVPAACSFFETYFGLAPVQARPGPRMAFLRDDNGLFLSLMNLDSSEPAAYPGTFHVGFILDTRADVDGMNDRLRQDGFAVEPAREFHGSYTFYLQAPWGVSVEVLTNAGAIGDQRASA